MSYQPNYAEPAPVPTSASAINKKKEFNFIGDFLAKEVHNHLMKIKWWMVVSETVLNPQENYSYSVVTFFLIILI